MKFLDTVAREQYDALKQDRDDWRTRYDALFAAYERLRPTHSPTVPLRVTAPKEEPGTRELHAIEASVASPRLAAIADNLMAQKPGLTRVAAMVEAKRLDDIARGRAIAPSVPPPEPPSR